MRAVAASHLPMVVLFDPESLSTEAHSEALQAGGFDLARHSDAIGARSALDESEASALVVVAKLEISREASGLIREAKSRGIPVVGVVEHSKDSASLSERVRDFDDWIGHSSHPSELPTRLIRTLGRHKTSPSQLANAIPMEVGLVEMIVHDIRNPLNVISLTVRVIEQLTAQMRVDLHEDLAFLRDNSGQIERMLALLSDFCRLTREESAAAPFEFDPRRLLEDILEERAAKGLEKGFPARLELDPSTPKTVALDPVRARLGLLFALFNASAATDRPLVVRSSGSSGRWTIAINVDKPPPATVHTLQIQPERFERLIGSAAERRGLDLAIAEWISRGFGGSIRLEVVPDERSTIVIDWPAKAP